MRVDKRLKAIDTKLSKLFVEKRRRNNGTISQLTQYADFAQKLIGAAAGIVSLCLIFGFIIMNANLLRYGVYDFGLLKAKVLSAGGLYLLFVSLVGLSYWRYGIAFSFIGLLAAIPLLLLVLWSVGMLKIEPPIGTFIQAVISWSFLMDAGVLGIHAIYMQITRPSVWASIKVRPRPSPLMILLFLAAIVIYGQYIYPQIAPAIGGGRPAAVVLVTDEDNSATLGYLVKLGEKSGQLMSEQVELLDQTEKVYFVLVPARDANGEFVKDKSGRVKKLAVEIDKDLVRGVIHVEPLWKELF